MALNWSRTVPVDHWQGVTVDGPEGRVTRLDLAGLGLNGRIPSDLGRLERLVSLQLRRNRLTGRIPPELSDLASLEHLSLSYNTLTGDIPPELGKLGNLKTLTLKHNRLTGVVPAALGELDLSVLRLSGNDFDSIPPELTDVADHDLGNMRLSTPLPPTSPARFDDRAVLLAVKETLAGDASNWHPTVPVGLWRGVTVDGPEGRVIGLDLAGLGLNGRIPPELGDLASLEHLNLSYNTLTGDIPPELGGLDNLFSLRLAGNDFHGCLPRELRRLRSYDIEDGFICVALAAALTMDRPLLWRLGFEKAMEAPLFGHGLGALGYMDGAPIGHHGKPLGPHNLYLTLLGEAGIVPLLLFVSALVLLLRAQWGAPGSLARDATAAGIIVIALYGMSFQHLLGVGAFMFLAGLSVATGTTHDDGDRHVAKA